MLTQVFQKGSGDAIGDGLVVALAFGSEVELTLYMGEVARSVRAAPTIAFSKSTHLIVAGRADLSDLREGRGSR